MRICPLVATLALLGLQPTFAADARPSEESVRRLFVVMHTSQIVDEVMSQMDANLRQAMERASGGRSLNAKQQQLHDEMRTRALGMLKDELAWSRVEPQMVEVYRNTFTPDEIDGMFKFYDSPGGKAVVAKLPQATQQMMQLTQERVRAVVPRIVELQKETAQKIKDAAGPPPAAPAPGAPASPPPSPPPSPQPSPPH
ncbi:MAG TPA: DUF2059 domain-containing protein [Steroidobacteraceae bacterium]|nr:DUF2059 domain-containing protein [Steroidobacteraceae bacterium]